MPGKWLTTIVMENEAVTASSTQNIDLPKSNFLSTIQVQLRGTGGSGTPAVEAVGITRGEVVMNGSAVLKYLSPTQSRQIPKRMFGTEPTLTNAANAETNVMYPFYFCRYRRDESVILSAKLAKTLILRLTHGATVAATAWATGSPCKDVVVDEYVSDDDPLSKLVLKSTEMEAKATGTGDVSFNLPLGNRYRSFWLEIGTTTSTDGIYIKVNNGAEVPFSTIFDLLIKENFSEFDFDATETANVWVHLDQSGDLSACLDSGIMNDLKFWVERGATTSTLTLMAEEIVALR